MEFEHPDLWDEFQLPSQNLYGLLSRLNQPGEVIYARKYKKRWVARFASDEQKIDGECVLAAAMLKKWITLKEVSGGLYVFEISKLGQEAITQQRIQYELQMRLSAYVRIVSTDVRQQVEREHRIKQGT